ncbi:gram-negative pili assembly chaperone, N-terminal domain protein [Collimonas arenae]|uniref:Gram-negative pili assembly chaperone, N-terminal domain protein n=1 Tax=Collimonas arenae TaxID=279058 RepID=A0A127QI74_9BURK|nr:fimbria/pilus periplasmic chaperone [Collimonas arenae]AMO99844.1 gram-negative pili assembly chaperone, N-terminal domain protein [Collimonas arenae]AMP09743.1 gram-negative pili assembly chaperone, N-terminal domain protein [Collimonas arenae]
MMQPLDKWSAALVLLLCSSVAQDIRAASFNVNPIGFDLSVERPSGVLQIRNTGDTPVRIQVGAVDWSTDGRQEVQADTDALLLNPPIFAIQPGQIQFLRFGMRNPATPATEKSYRLLIEEVPSGGPQPPGLKTLLRVSIPVFIVPLQKQESISWQLRRQAGGLVLIAANNGNVHNKIVSIQLSNPDGKDALQISTPAYVLPGQHKEWPLANGTIRSGLVRLHVQTDKGEIEEQLTLEADQVSSR